MAELRGKLSQNRNDVRNLLWGALGSKPTGGNTVSLVCGSKTHPGKGYC